MESLVVCLVLLSVLCLATTTALGAFIAARLAEREGKLTRMTQEVENAVASLLAIRDSHNLLMTQFEEVRRKGEETRMIADSLARRKA